MSISPSAAAHSVRVVATEDRCRQKIEQFVRAAEFDYDAAQDAVLKAMESDSALRRYVQREGARYCVRNFCSGLRRAASCDETSEAASDGKARSYIETRPVTPGKPFSRLQPVLDKYLDNWPLPGGKLLGDARREDLKAAIEYYGMQEVGMRRQRKFLEAVGKKLPEGRKVREVFTGAQLKRIEEGAK
jgi:hypothetical protein